MSLYGRGGCSGGGGGGSSNTQADVTKEIQIPALGLVFHDANFPQVQELGSTSALMVASFDDGNPSTEYGRFQFYCPQDIDTSGTITYEIQFVVTGALTSKKITWNIETVPIADNEAHDAAYQTAVASAETDLTGSALDTYTITWTETVSASNWQAGELVKCRLSRPRTATTASEVAEDAHMTVFVIRIPCTPGLS